ncbi:hypothetical protein XOO1134 [Xanthomonas oryzae pv. oryzae KACC 10331]|uniref:Uncharacterized protein n=1 Tax=Xanthomonas oryzae pv. oryzae (strain KACC10331 / KXO85) TaxID=291331 RepID=Q5H3T3_XANOR|nr:hypothetical protein XOO1134 [Xanthomonas oryzae pv. oryzae KACC 10331]
MALAKEGGLSRMDHVLMSEANNRGVHGGENVFVVQGDPRQPGTSARAHENRTGARHAGRTIVRARAATRRAERASAAARTRAGAAAQRIERLATSSLARRIDDVPGKARRERRCRPQRGVPGSRHDICSASALATRCTDLRHVCFSLVLQR